MSLTDDFLYVEEKYGLNQIKIDGFTPWVYMRFGMWDKHMNPLRKLKKGWIRRTLNQLKKLSDTIIMLAKRNNLPNKTDICFVTVSTPVRTGRFHERRRIDPIAELFPDSIILEYPNGNLFLGAKNLGKTIYAVRLKLKSSIKATFKRIFSNTYKNTERLLHTYFDDAIAELTETSGINFISEHWVKSTAYKFLIYKEKYKEYKKLLQRIFPRVIVEACHYTRDTMIINEVAKELGILTIELQHGIIDREHIAYNYPKGDVISQFADRLFLFGEYWKTKAAYPLDEDRIVAVGYPHFERQIHMYCNNREHEKESLLFLSQPIISARCSFDRLAVDALSRLSKKGWNVIFKLHPGEYRDWKERYPKLLNTNVKVVADSIPLYQLFSEATAVVGLNSTSLYESIGFGLPIFIYNVFGAERMDDLCELGYAEKFNYVDDLCYKLERIKKDDTHIGIEIWKDNALNNIKSEINSLLMG